MFTNRKNKGKITFGNIMLTLLVLGLFVVIGLIGTLYVTLTKTPEQTAANYKREQESQAQIECWSPTNKSGRDCGASAPAQTSNTIQKSAASAIAGQIEAEHQAASEAGLLDDGALTRGDAPKKPKKITPKNAGRELIPQNSGDEGTPLVAQEERQTRPVAEQQPRPAKKSRAEIDTTGERVLTPAPRPSKRDNSDATNALFD